MSNKMSNSGIKKLKIFMEPKAQSEKSLKLITFKKN